MEAELRPCPFCGRQATIVRHPGTNWDGSRGKEVNVGAMHGLWYVGCSYPFFEDEVVCGSGGSYSNLE